MKKIAYFASLVILAGLVVVACKKDDDSTPPTEENKHAITDLDPKEGPVGQEVVIIGTNFTDQNATAAIGGTAAVITGVNTDKTELYIEVPNGATDGKISVTIDGLRVESTQIFDVTETIAGPESIELAETDLAMRSLETISVPEITNIADFDNPMVQWESNTPETAVVDNDGNITALQAGEAQIEVSINSASGELNTTIEVTVEESILVVGSFDNGNYDVASLWLNEEQIVLGDETDYSNAASVNGRYVAGYEGNRACVWHIKNKGEINRIDLTADGVGYAEAKSVVNIGDDVIAAGFIYKDENENSM
ncbi:MAG: IPT/TIG domain-containing protein, partial [Bacteroidota bacterium]